ncbi:MAG: hypothetical protein WBV39_02720 [Rudaea sp.]
MTDRFDHELSAPLAATVRGMDHVPSDAADAAQQRLLARLQMAHRPRRTPVRWIVAGASVALVVLVMILVPAPRSGDAFAAVVNHFRSFKTLSMTVAQRIGERTLQTSHTVVNAKGVLRTDIGDHLSVIVDPTKGRVLTLLHDEKKATLSAIPKSSDARADSLQWLEDLRHFKGEATALPEPRMIRGQLAHGWKLKVHGVGMEIWADASGLPLTMRQTNGVGLEINYRFEFDPALTPGELSSDVPTGYELVKPDTD